MARNAFPLASAFVVVAGIIADLPYSVLDPRVRVS